MTLSLKNQERTQFLQAMVEAMRKEDTDAYLQAFTGLTELIEKNVLDKAKELAGCNDVSILSARGVRVLTSEEKTYYEKLAQAMRSADPKQALDKLDVVMPQTVVDSVFDDLKGNHELLAELDFVNTEGMVKYLMNTNGTLKAVWGALTGAIAKELAGGFKEVNMTSLKLSAFLPISKAMLELGPNWLDRYVRECLAEAIANGIEEGVIANLNTSTGPIGMIADLSKGTVADGVITYTAKEAIAVKNFYPETYGPLIAKLAKTENGKSRVVKEAILIVNPVDYFTKVLASTTVLTGDGSYRRDVFPFPTKTIQSVAVAEGKAVLGLPKKYFVGLAMSSKEGKISFSDECQFLEDNRVYTSKLYGNGMPKDNTAFIYLDISAVEPALIRVEHVTSEATA